MTDEPCFKSEAHPVVMEAGPRAVALTRAFLASEPVWRREQSDQRIVLLCELARAEDAPLHEINAEDIGAWQVVHGGLKVPFQWLQYLDDGNAFRQESHPHAAALREPTLAERLATGKSLSGTTVKQPDKDADLERG